MPIQSDDIKLLKSAVMADTPEGGGAITGTEIVDGQSNNIFPDVSTDDRAAGRVNFRKIGGQAQTSNTDTLLGASFILLEPPEDPLVHVSLFETPGWFDERTTAKELVERYLVKGPRLSCRLMETHYAGSVLLQLYQVGGSNFPSAGDAVALRNPNGAEQYVRVLKVTLGRGNYTVFEGSGTVSFDANIAVCEIGQALEFDVLGPPIGRAVNEGSYAQVYSTSASTGVQFHGIKALAAPAVVGDRSVMVAGGIYTPIVPAATLEEPLVDIAPLVARQSLSRTAAAALTLPAEVLTLGPGVVLRLPTAAEPGSVTVTRGATVFTDDGAGLLKQGTTTVGSVDYRGKAIAMAAGSPSYGSASTVVAYRPATPGGAAVHSRDLLITQANQGLGFTAVFDPAPAPGTFTLSYMAQGRWYELQDNGNGKLSGADSSYGAGTLSYVSGSAAFTLGAIPDVGSSIIYQWGDAAAAEAVAPADLPARLRASMQLSTRVLPATLTLSWTASGAPKTATCSAAGVISGDATGTCTGGLVGLEPTLMPDGSITTAYDQAPTSGSGATNNGNGTHTLANAPINPGTLRISVATVPQTGFEIPASVSGYDTGSGIIVSSTPGVVGSLGTVNYTTGVVTLNSTTAMDVYERVVQSYAVGSNILFYEARVKRASHSVDLFNLSGAVNAYAYGSATPATETLAPTWGLSVKTLTGLALATDALAFTVGGQVYTAAGGVLQKGWLLTTGAGAAAGSVGSGGTIGITSLPGAGQANTVLWANAAQSRAVGKVGQGVFRVASAPIKTGVFQIQAGALVGSSNNAGVISGDGWTGTVDFQRGIVRWSRSASFSGVPGLPAWEARSPVAADQLTYNAVFLQYLPLDGSLLGLETARLPLDGKAPCYRGGGQIVVHETLSTTLPNPLVKGTVYNLGRQRIAAVVARTLDGSRVSGALYTADFDLGTITFPLGSDLTGLAQPFTVHHRIEDELMVLRADISGKLDLVAALTHNYPAATSYVSSKLRKGDLFARSFGHADRSSWLSTWDATNAGAQPTASYNSINYPIQVTNRGAIVERWAVIFTAGSVVRVVGEHVGQVLTGVSTNAAIEPLNPATGVPYFSIPALGWGGGWAAGNVLLFETDAAGSTAWVARTVLQGPPSVQSDQFTLAFRADVDA